MQVARLEPCMSLEKLLPTLVLLTSFVRIRCDKSPQGYAIYFWDIIQCVVLLVYPAALKFSACGILSSSRYIKIAKHLLCLSVTDIFFVKFGSVVRNSFLCVLPKTTEIDEKNMLNKKHLPKFTKKYQTKIIL